MDLIPMTITSKAIREQMIQLFKQQVQHVLRQPWSLAKAMKQMEKMMLHCSRDGDLLHKFALDNRCLPSTRWIQFHSVPIKNLIEVLSIETGQTAVTLEGVMECSVGNTTPIYNTAATQRQYHSSNVKPTVGHSLLRHVSLSGIVAFRSFQVLQVLSHLPQIEGLALDMKPGVNSELIMHTGNEHLFIPLMHRLKVLHVNTGMGVHDESTLSQVLRIAPNLVELEYKATMHALNDAFLRNIAACCPSIQKLSISGTSFTDHHFSDEGIMQLVSQLKNLRHLQLPSSGNLSGSCLLDIGSVGGNLEYLEIGRIGHLPTTMRSGVSIGGGMMPKLKKLVLKGTFEFDIRNIGESLNIYTPNLAEFIATSLTQAAAASILRKCHSIQKWSICSQDSDVHIEAAAQNMGLEELEVQRRNMDSFFKYHWNVKSLKLCIESTTAAASTGIAKRLLSSCPLLTKLQVHGLDNVGDFAEVLNDVRNWPDLQQLFLEGFPFPLVFNNRSAVIGLDLLE